MSLPKGRDAKNDLIAGLTTGLVQIPDAMASAILAAVKPVNGLNTLVIGTPIGALFAGSVFMTVTTTGAIAIAVADAGRPSPPLPPPSSAAEWARAEPNTPCSSVFYLW